MFYRDILEDESCYGSDLTSVTALQPFLKHMMSQVYKWLHRAMTLNSSMTPYSINSMKKSRSSKSLLRRNFLVLVEYSHRISFMSKESTMSRDILEIFKSYLENTTDTITASDCDSWLYDISSIQYILKDVNSITPYKIWHSFVFPARRRSNRLKPNRNLMMKEIITMSTVVSLLHWKCATR